VDTSLKVLRYGTRSLGISQFYLHTRRSSANGMNHTCLCLPSRSWYSFTNPGGIKYKSNRLNDKGWLVAFPSAGLASRVGHTTNSIGLCSWLLAVASPNSLPSNLEWCSLFNHTVLSLRLFLVPKKSP